VTLFERYLEKGEAYGCNQNAVALATWVGQSFTIGTTGDNLDHKLTSIGLWARRRASPGNCTIEVYKCDASHKPTGAALDTMTFDSIVLTLDVSGALYTALFTGGAILEASTEYCFIAKALAAGALEYVYLLGGSTTAPCAEALYGGWGRKLETINSGVAWTVSATQSIYFQEIGHLLVPPYNMTFAGNMAFKC